MAITLRSVKAAELTHNELDANFVDLDTRTKLGWRDLTSPITDAGVAVANAPVRAAFGPAHTPQHEQFAFDINDYVFCEGFHVNHDILVGGKAYIHVHWSTSGTNVQPVKWEMTIMRALGHNQANFAAPIVKTVTGTPHGTAWRHMITEVALVDALTLVEPDELILVTLRRITNGGTDNTDNVFALMVDFHYEVDRHSTINKVPNFYA